MSHVSLAVIDFALSVLRFERERITRMITKYTGQFFVTFSMSEKNYDVEYFLEDSHRVTESKDFSIKLKTSSIDCQGFGLTKY